MKFEYLYINKIKEYSPYIRRNLFNYTLIKEYVKQGKITNYKQWKSILRYELEKCDELLYPNINCCWYCCCYHNLTNDDTDQLSALCAVAFFKSCKKIQKYLNIPMMEYRESIINKHKYNFLGSAKRTNISLTASEYECPICLDMKKNLLIMSCGHYLCKDCAETMWTPKINTLTGLTSAGLTSVCPMCRCKVCIYPGHILWKVLK